MTNPTRKQIIDAHKALSDLTYLADKYISAAPGGLDETRKLRRTIKKALPPIPQPTMAEIEWDDEKHYLAEAENPNWGKVIMLHKSFFDGFINVLVEAGCSRKLPAEHLTLTGRRYTPTEVQE